MPEDSQAARNGSLRPEHLDEDVLRHVRALNEVARSRGQRLAQMALRWAVRDPRVTSAVIGASSVDQLDVNLDALNEAPFTDEELALIDRDAVDADINLWAESAGTDLRPLLTDGEVVHDRLMTKFVYAFSEGSKDQKDLLGGKGPTSPRWRTSVCRSLPGSSSAPKACRAYLAEGREPDALAAEVAEHLAALEKTMGKALGQPDDPLLVSVRSRPTSMPGMMEAVLNIGLNDESVHGLAARAGDERFAYDSYRRLLTMFGKTVLGMEGHLFEDEMDARKAQRGSTKATST